MPRPSVSYQWLRGGKLDWRNVVGACGSTYEVTEDDVGCTIRVEVTVANDDGSVTVIKEASR